VQISEKNSFGLLELKMAALECFWRKTPLGPLGVNTSIDPIIRIVHKIANASSFFNYNHLAIFYNFVTNLSLLVLLNVDICMLQKYLNHSIKIINFNYI
jgi:hypothetical protein